MKTILIIIVVLLALTICAAIFLSRPQFGKYPEGQRKTRIKQSPNYKNGEFQNLMPTQMMNPDKGYLGVMYGFLFEKSDKAVPKNEIPSMKTDLLNLGDDENILVWFGHSSLFIRFNGVNFLIDPVFSNSAAPLPFLNKAFKGANVYSVSDMPKIDYLIITHDHWDHLDYPTIQGLIPITENVIASLGVGSHLEYWGFNNDNITETDWNDDISLKQDLEIFCLTARHFSGRNLINNNQTLWSSFLIKSPDYKIYLSGDSGYGPHFEEIGKKFGGVDFAALENGQYNEDWKQIHMLPHETAQAARDLKAKKVMSVHNSKFLISRHAWDDPIKNLIANKNDNDSFKLVTPIMGEKVELKSDNQTFQKWWEKII